MLSARGAYASRALFIGTAMKRFACFRMLALISLSVFILLATAAAEQPVTVTDAAGNRIIFRKTPERVVSLAPYVTEMLLAFDREEVIAGLTLEDLDLFPALRRRNVGGFFSPDIQAIAACRPDLVIAAPYHKEVIKHFEDGDCPVMVMDAGKIEEAFTHMEMIGRVFACEDRAAAVIRENREKMTLVADRLAAVPEKDRKRVVRVMAGNNELWCPGDDSFQNETIVAAGGVTPEWGKNGFAAPVSLEQWRAFNPQLIYGCDLNESDVRALLNREGWREVDAVRNGAVAMFPCHLTCRVSVRVGDFVQWLAAVLYMETFADPATAVLPDTVLETKPLQLDFDYVNKAELVRHRVADAEYKSLAVRFKTPMDVISTFEGPLSGVAGVGNTYVPMHASLGHMAFGVEPAREAIRKNLGFARDQFAGLMTGADMDNLAVREERWQNLKVTALATAGVKGNAMRMSKDAGSYYPHGTINIIVLTNHRLSAGAMARAIVTVTEAKSAALLDMDIRSTYSSLDHQATGTGTDNVIIVQGRGPEIALGGGHTKHGELIARAVHGAVTEAIGKQNGIKPDRSIFQRLADRHLTLSEIVKPYPADMGKKELTAELTEILRKDDYAAFLCFALAVSDDYQQGLIRDLGFFDELCRLTAVKLTGGEETGITEIPTGGVLPVVLDRAFGALIAGIDLRQPEGKTHHD